MKRRTFLGATLAALSAALSGISFSLRAAAAQLAPAVKSGRILLPPVPRWNPKTDDVDGADFAQKCRDFERTFLPRDIVFPRTGQVWEAVRDCTLPCWGARPNSKMLLMPEEIQLAKGERVRILPLDDPKPLTVRFERVGVETAHETMPLKGFPRGMWLQIAPTFPGPPSAQRDMYFKDLFRLVEGAA
jgi:hypothetical protein